MQGFNKYYPPDFDPEKHSSLNAYRGKHALGDRARKLDQGILITRFELPFNIWCGGCGNHIGMGVRYNAEKKKIGNYYSTPIYSFRCKCHLCDNWFTIETDPKNTRYVVTSGAKQKDEDWDPAENGGFAIHDTDAASQPVDPLAALEKSTEAQNHVAKVQAPRLEALQTLSDHYGSDPFSHSLRVRRKFRVDKKVEQLKRDADNTIRNKYGLPEEFDLGNDDEDVRNQAQDEWSKARRDFLADSNAKRRRTEAELGLSQASLASKSKSSIGPSRTVPSSSSLSRMTSTVTAASGSSAVSALKTRLLHSKTRSSDPFLTRQTRSPQLKDLGVMRRK